MKFVETLVTFIEVPDEISLCINISNCPCHCPGCSEPWLADDIGEELTAEKVVEMAVKNRGITCICFMGGDDDYFTLWKICQKIKIELPHLKLAMYSGRILRNPLMSSVLDYYKVGPWDAKCGPLNSPTTNQIFYQKIDNNWIDITNKFWKEKK